MTGCPSEPGRRPSTNGLRSAQQQCPSATQHSIEQKSGSFAINGATGDSQPSISANIAADACKRVKILFLTSFFIMPRYLSAMMDAQFIFEGNL
jgi:hypothetical protein